MKPIALSLAAALLAAPAFAVDYAPVEAPTGTYAEDDSHTSLVWRVKHLGLSNYTARFTDVNIALEFNAEDPALTKVSAEINPKSAMTAYPFDNKNFDAEVSDAEFLFNANAHPAVTFTSQTVEPTGPNTALVTGPLTMLGQTHPVTLEVTYNGSMAEHPFVKVPALGFSAKTVIKRSEWGMDFLIGKGLADEVEVIIETELLKK